MAQYGLEWKVIVTPRECVHCFKVFEIHHERDEDDMYTIDPPFCPFCGQPDPDMELPEYDEEDV